MSSEVVRKFNRERILWCLNQNRVPIDKLAKKAGTKPSILENALHNNGTLTMKQLQNIAQYFHRGLLFFFETAPVDEENVDSLQFRTLNNQKPTLEHRIKVLIRRIEEQRLIFVELLEESEHIDWTLGQPQRDDKESISAYAERVRTWLELGDINDFESYRLALEGRGILVFVSNGYKGAWEIDKSDPIRGISLYFEQYPVILAKKQKVATAQSFTLMHELGHLLFHRKSFVDEDNDFSNQPQKVLEHEANEFAGQILVPNRFLEQVDHQKLIGLDIEEFDDFLEKQRNNWGVSGEVILRRLLNEGLLDQTTYTSYHEYKKSLLTNAAPPSSGGSRYREREPLKIFGRTYVGVVLNALYNEEISIIKAGRYLDGLNIEQIRKLEAYLVSH
jgi:Zn-dependent peptidase ImmA (M78 family)